MSETLRGPSPVRPLTGGADYVPPDPTVIETSGPSLDFWSHTLGVSPEALQAAAGRVGPDLERVKTELGVGGVG